MNDFYAARPMEDFFINPTSYMEFETQLHDSAMADDNGLYAAGAPRNDGLIFRHHKESLNKATATLTELVNEPNFWHAYTSDEEVASPVDNDDISVHSEGSIESIASSVSLPELLAVSCNKVEQQCNRAQAVKIQSFGKARMVSMPKIVDIPPQRSPLRPATSASNERPRSSVPRLKSVDHISSGRSSQDSRNDSTKSSNGKSPISTAPSSIYEEDEPRVKRKKSFARHVPLMEAAQRPMPTSPTSVPHSPMLLQSVDSIKRADTILSDRSSISSVSSMKPAIRRMNKFSSNFSLSKVGRGSIRLESLTESRKGKELESVKEPEAVFVTRQAPQPRVPSRSSSIQVKPKMVARAANERLPPITLPPCPDEAEESEWPLRGSSITAQSQHHLRRQTMSARVTSSA